MDKNVLRYALMSAGMAASAPVVAAGVRWLVTGEPPKWIDDRIDRRRVRRAALREPMPQVLHELELKRLSEEVQRVRADRQPGQYHRVRATTAAYDGALVQACRSMGIEPPTGNLPLSDAQRYETETALMAAGVQW